MMAAGLEDKYFKGLVITETVKRAVVSELTPLGTHPIVLWIFQSGIRLRQAQKFGELLNNRQIFCKLFL